MKPKEKILIYDTDAERLKSLKTALKKHHILNTTTSSLDRCIKEMKNRKYKHIFLGRLQNGDIIKIYTATKDKKIEKHSINTYDTTLKEQVKKELEQIHNILKE
ncbi:MAG: hypothetical protein KKD39_00015 [Candidatus Altiarchaeota archaeon]|nr:hypothetical protein [Candidatus Altiarchaeota archaeon]